jgi:DNA ligase-1
MNFKPMLADDVNFSILRYPVLVSPKLDGVRATYVDGRLISRSLKPHGNRALSNTLCSAPLDGELIVGDPTDRAAFTNTMKVVSAHGASIAGLRLYVFDAVILGQPFVQRLDQALRAIQQMDNNFLTYVPHQICANELELFKYEEKMIRLGYEGVMIRSPDGAYKFGRATTREGTLLKMKRKLRSEATVIGFEEQLHNANELKVDNLGYAERSSHQANKIPMNTLGALNVKDVKSGVEFNIGTGFTFQDRDEIWKNRATYLGKIVSYEYLPSVKDKPRHPIWLGFRAPEDT